MHIMYCMNLYPTSQSFSEATVRVYQEMIQCSGKYMHFVDHEVCHGHCLSSLPESTIHHSASPSSSLLGLSVILRSGHW